MTKKTNYYTAYIAGIPLGTRRQLHFIKLHANIYDLQNPIAYQSQCLSVKVSEEEEEKILSITYILTLVGIQLQLSSFCCKFANSAGFIIYLTYLVVFQNKT